MAIGMLREDLLNLPGVEHAELDGDPIAPAGIRVRLSDDVDPSTVADDVRRVLAVHGLRPDIDGEEPQPQTSDADASSNEPLLTDGEHAPDIVVTMSRRLTSIGITEERDGVLVTATGPSGAVSVRAAGVSVPAIDRAVVEAVAEVFGTVTRPLVCSVEERDLDGTSVITLVIEEGGERLVGSAVVRSGRAYAVGRAVWTALSSR